MRLTLLLMYLYTTHPTQATLAQPAAAHKPGCEGTHAGASSGLSLSRVGRVDGVVVISELLEEILVLLRHVSPVGQPQGGRLPVGSSGRLGKWPLRVARSCDLAAAGNTI